MYSVRDDSKLSCQWVHNDWNPHKYSSEKESDSFKHMNVYNDIKISRSY